MTQELSLTINGVQKVVAVTAPARLADVVRALGFQPDRIAVEHNGRIVRRTMWGAAPVEEGDRLEVVHFVGGGA